MNSFNINGYMWNVRYVNSWDDILKTPSGIYTLGVTDMPTRTVYISKQVRGELLKKVLLHEICHCVVFSYGMSWDKYDEERLCDFVATYSEYIIDKAMLVLYGNKNSESVFGE